MPEAATAAPVGSIALIGAGLIGGSFVLALRRRYPGIVVRAFDRDPRHAELAVELGVATEACADLASAVHGAGLVILAVPVGALPPLFADLAAVLPPDALVTDVGSTKSDVVAHARVHLGAAFPRFVPGHPISGAERSGPQAARGDLFVGRRVVLTPLDDTDASALARVSAWWEVCGATVHRLSAEQHDRVFAAVSHLPHVLSYALVDAFARRPDADLLFAYAAGGFRDFTRIAASSPAMWRDICLANRDALLQELDTYLAAVQDLRAQVAQGDGQALFETFANAQTARVRWGEARTGL